MKSKLSLGAIVGIIVVLIILLCCCACPVGCGSLSYSSGQSISKKIIGNPLPNDYYAVFGIDITSLTTQKNQVDKIAFIINSKFSTFLISEGKFDNNDKKIDAFYELLGDQNGNKAEYNVVESGTLSVNDLTFPKFQVDQKSGQPDEKLLGTYIDYPDKTIFIIYSDDINVYNESNLLKFIQIFKLPKKM